MGATSLDNLPNDLILDILEQLDRPRDVAKLSATSRLSHNVIQQDGWRVFVRKTFSHLNIPSTPSTDWAATADRLTYLDRCWDKRAFVLNNFSEKREKKEGRQPNTQERQSVEFHPALDAKLLSGGQDELGVWGTGEHLITRLSSPGSVDEWCRLDGGSIGYKSGFGDVTAISVIDSHPRPKVAVGRANGDLNLLNATGSGFSHVVQTLNPLPQGAESIENSSSRPSPAQISVSWTEWQSNANLLASCTNTTLSLYDLRNTEATDLHPVAINDLSRKDEEHDVSLIRNIKFMGRDTLVCSLGGTRDPLRYAKITSHGLEFSNISSISVDSLDFLATKADLERGGRTTVRALETVGNTESLLLSAWDDGSYKLMDIRTPSPHDAVYRDRWQPFEPGSSLLVYGMRHFVAGSNMSPDLRFFDFRFPRPYHHTDGLPCANELPTPRPPFARKSGGEELTAKDLAVSKCDLESGLKMCLWHAESKIDYWRPDATLHLGRSWRHRVHALAKASDTSSRFYIGLEGAVTEATLAMAKDCEQDIVPLTCPEGWQVKPPGGRIGLIENGLSLVREQDWTEEAYQDLEIWHQNRTAQAAKEEPAGSVHRRLDSAYRPPPPRPLRNGSRRNQRGWR